MEVFLLNKFFHNNSLYVSYMAELIEIIKKDSKAQNEKSQTTEKSSKNDMQHNQKLDRMI